MTSTAAPHAADVPAHEQISAARRWAMLFVGTASQAATAAMTTAPAFLIPQLHRPVAEGGHGMPLAQAGLVSSGAMAGMMCTLVLWGFVVDRRGERFSLFFGLLGASIGGLLATLTDRPLFLAAALFFAGAAGASTNSASGRVVVGWFPPARRGLAMGIRQTGQPLGVGLAAGTIAVLAERYGVGTALWVPTAAAMVAAIGVLVVVLDPPRPARPVGGVTLNPYRQATFLQRIHLASVLLVVPQFLLWTYALTWLIDDLGWAAGVAGAVVAATQVVGAAARIGAGWVSDVVGSRMRPMRGIAVLASVILVLLGLLASVADRAVVLTVAAVVLMVLGSAITVADNGLAFTSIAERAGPFWAGRALGLQNTGQHIVAALVPPVAGLSITHLGYGATFAVAGVLPLLAIGVVPVRDEHPSE